MSEAMNVQQFDENFDLVSNQFMRAKEDLTIVQEVQEVKKEEEQAEEERKKKEEQAEEEDRKKKEDTQRNTIIIGLSVGFLVICGIVAYKRYKAYKNKQTTKRA